MISKGKLPISGGNLRYGTLVQIYIFIFVCFVGSMMFLLKWTQQNTEINTKNSTTVESSLIQSQEYIPINMEYSMGAAKMGFVVNKKIVPECDFMDYIFGMPVSQADPCLIAAVKEKFVIQPATQNPFQQINHLNFKDDLPTNIEKFKWVEKLLIENSTDGLGFFIECGANDGSFISPTIRLEREYNWTGVLIEANPIPFQRLLEKKRNAYAVNAALCTGKSPQPITFFTNPANTGMSGIHKRVDRKVTVDITVQCLPFYSVLKALDLKSVDYLSLDVEGLELDILKTLPFGRNYGDGDEVVFKVMTIEHWSVPGGEQALKDFLEPRGYKFIKTMTDILTRDSLFVHHSLYEKAKLVHI